MIYLIKRTASRLGDAIMLEPLISTVKEHHPDDEIWVQVRDWIAPIFQNHPDVSRVLPESSAVPQEAIRILDIATDDDCPWAKYAARFSPSITKSKQAIYAKVAGHKLAQSRCWSPTRKAFDATSNRTASERSVESHAEGEPSAVHSIPPSAPSHCLPSNQEVSLPLNAPRYEYDGRGARLHLNEEEEASASQLRAYCPGVKVGIQMRPSESWREYPHMELLIKYLLKKTRWHVFLYDHAEVPNVEGTIPIVGRGLREVMWHIKAMDVFVGPDSGLLQLSAALGTPTYGLFGATNPNVILDGHGDHVFWNKKPRFCKRAYCWFTPCEKIWCLRLLSPRKVLKDIKNYFLISQKKFQWRRTVMEPKARWSHTARLARCYPSKTEAFRAWRRLCAPRRVPPLSVRSRCDSTLRRTPSASATSPKATPVCSMVSPKHREGESHPITPIPSGSFAIMRLDGLGGTLTLSSQARKIKERTGGDITLIIRHHPELFDDNPHVDHVITVGAIKWDECLQVHKDKFIALADVRMAIGKWYDPTNIFNQDFTSWESYYEQFPLNQQELSIYGLHHIQLTNKILGLPFEEIQSRVYFDLSLPEWFAEGVPSEGRHRTATEGERDYICLCPGIDTIHEGKMQTKCWPYWQELVEKIDMPVIQLGTEYDDKIFGALDLRGKTTIKEAGAILSHASVVVAIEGGLMHLAHAVGQEKVVVLFGPTSGHLFLYPTHVHVDSFPCKGCFSMIENWAFECKEGIDALCMRSITPARVLYACNRLLGRQSSEQIVD